MNNRANLTRFGFIATSVFLLMFLVGAVSASSFPYPCTPGNSTIAVHVHPWLRIIINGSNFTIPAGIGTSNNATVNVTYQNEGGHQVVVNAGCFEPLHVHDNSGILHLELTPVQFLPYTLQSFFTIWNDTPTNAYFQNATVNTIPTYPIIYTPTDLLGHVANSTYGIVLLVDGQSYNLNAPLVLYKYDYCNVNTIIGAPCNVTAGIGEAPGVCAEPIWNYTCDSEPYGIGHTLVLEYTSVAFGPTLPLASNLTVDQGQSTAITSSLPTTGTSPFTYSWLVKVPGSGSFTAADSSTCSTPSGSNGAKDQNVTCIFVTNSSTPAGKYQFELASTGINASAMQSPAANVTVAVDPTLSLGVSNPRINQNESTTLTATVGSGVGPLKVNFFFANTKTLLATVNVSSGTAQFVVNGSKYFPQSYQIGANILDLGATTPFIALFNESKWVNFTVIAGNQSTITTTSTSTSTTTSTTTVPVNTLKATSTAIGKAPFFDVGQVSEIIAPIVNGTKLVYDFFVSNTTSLETSGNISFNSIFYTTYATGLVSANVLITNNTNTTRYNAIPANFTVNPDLAVLQNPIVNQTSAPINTSVLITTYAVNGTAPYTYNFIISNSTSDKVKQISGPLSSNTFKYFANTLGAFQANVIVTDSAGVPESINSIYSVSFTVNNSTVNTTTTTTTIPQSNGGGGGSVGGGGGGAGTPHPIEKLQANSCYVISNFATPAYFNNVTINGTTPTVTENYITPTFAGISVDGAPYQINPNTTPTVVNGGTDHEYTIALLNITILPLQNTITIELCPTGKLAPTTYNVSSSTAQPTWIEIFANKVSVANVSVTNYSTPAISSLPKLPANTTVLSVFNITAKGAAANSTVNVTAHYPCTVSTSSISVYVLSSGGNSTWSKVASTFNASACTTSFAIPSDPILAILQAVAPTSPQVPPANATTTIATTTIPTSGSASNSTNSTGTGTPKSNMKNVAIWVGAGIIILAIIAGIAYEAYQSRKSHKITPKRNR